MPELFVAPADDAICLRIGKVVTQWMALEKSISLLLGTLLMAEQGAMFVVTTRTQLSTQIKWMRALLNSHDHEAEQSKPVLELLSQAEELRQERNEFIHGTWDTSGCEAGTCIVSTTNLDRNEIIRSRLVTSHDLDVFVARFTRGLMTMSYSAANSVSPAIEEKPSPCLRTDAGAPPERPGSTPPNQVHSCPFSGSTANF